MDSGAVLIAMSEFKAKVTGRELGFSAATRARNPHLFGSMGSLDTPQPEQNTRPALEQKPSRYRGSTRRLAVIVTIIRVGGKILDGDNLQGACKPLRDAIANTLGLDDGDSRIEWQYRQIGKGKAESGAIVKLEML